MSETVSPEAIGRRLDSLQNNVSGVTRRMITLENTLSSRMGALEAQVWALRGRASIGCSKKPRPSAEQGELPRPFEPIQHDLGPAIAAVWALYESTFKDACVMDWTQDEATMELAARPQVISLGH